MNACNLVPVGSELWWLWQLLSSIDLCWGKWKLTFFSVSLVIFGFFLQKYLFRSPLRFIRLLSKSLNLIGCQGDKKDGFSKTNVKFFYSHKP